MTQDYLLESHEAFFIDRAYWNGHMLGDDGAEMLAAAAENSKETDKFVSYTLSDHLPQPDEPPVQAFNSGEGLDLNRLNEGTVLLFAMERLFKPVGKLVAESYDNRFGAVLEDRLPHNQLKDQGSSRAAHFNELQYMWDVFWGVVTSGQQDNAVQRISNLPVFRSRGGGVAYLAKPVPTPHALFEAVGKAIHVQRVNLAEIYYYGQGDGRLRKQKPKRLSLQGFRRSAIEIEASRPS
jgi:hypothetical protein